MYDKDPSDVPITAVPAANKLDNVRLIPANKDYDFPVIDTPEEIPEIDEHYVSVAERLFDGSIREDVEFLRRMFDELGIELEAEASDDLLTEVLEELIAEQILYLYWEIPWKEIEEAGESVEEVQADVLHQLYDLREEIIEKSLENILKRLDEKLDEEEEDSSYLEESRFSDLEDRPFEEVFQRSPIWAATLTSDREAALEIARSTSNLWTEPDEVARFKFIEGVTPLMQAAANQSPEFVKLLLEKGADPNRYDSEGYAPLTYALLKERLDNFQVLLAAGAAPDPVPERQGEFSPLTMAADHGLEGAIEALLERGANVDWRSASGATPLKYAAAGGHLRCVELLLSAGADPNAVDDEGFSPIHNAVDGGHLEVVRRLLEAGVDVDLPVGEGSEDQGRTPLDRACARLDRPLFELLVSHGADTGVVAADGSTPISTTIVAESIRSENGSDLIRYLMDQGVEPGLKDLLLAAYQGSVDTFREIYARISSRMTPTLVLEFDGQSMEMNRKQLMELVENLLSNMEDSNPKRVQELRHIVQCG